MIYTIANSSAVITGKESSTQPQIPIPAKIKKNFFLPLKSAIVPKIGHTNKEINATMEDTAPQIEVAMPDESLPAKLLK
jgi:hypothetical protein